MSVEALLMGLGAWLAFGSLIAVAFGSFSRRSDLPEEVTELAPPVVQHLRPHKRATQKSSARTVGVCPAAVGMVVKPRRRTAQTG